MILVKNLFKYYYYFKVVDDLLFDIVLGNIVGFFGLNGVGKFIIMKMLIGFLLFMLGDIVIQNKCYVLDVKVIQCNIGYLFEGVFVYGDMMVW